MSHRALLKSHKALQKYLRKELPNLQQSSVLIVSSSPPHDRRGVPAVEEICKKMEFTLGAQMGLRTAKVTIPSAFPTKRDLELAIEMSRRVGATRVIGVGSGAAIDLAKSLSSNESTLNVTENLLLVPATMGAAMACCSPVCLFLSTEEESLTQNLVQNIPTNVVVDSDAMFAPYDRKAKKNPDAVLADAVLASLAVAFDAAGRGLGDRQKVSECLLKSIQAIQYLFEGKEKEAREAALIVSMIAGEIICGGSKRTLPFALASALLPKHFPHGNMLTFMASILPGLCATIEPKFEKDDGPDVDDWGEVSDQFASALKVPPLAALAEGTPDVKTLMSSFYANQSLMPVQTIDPDDDEVEAVLHRSLNR